VEHGQHPGEGLLTRLKLLPLMKQVRPLDEVVREVARLTDGLPQSLREETLGTMLGLGYNYLDLMLIDQLLKEPTVANALEQLVIDSLARGKVEGQREDNSQRSCRPLRRGSRESARADHQHIGPGGIEAPGGEGCDRGYPGGVYPKPVGPLRGCRPLLIA
jgi:hypothetical protein